MAARTIKEVYRQFVHPSILFAEQVVPANTAANIQQQELKTSRDMIVDYLAVSEETFSQDLLVAGGGQTFLRYIDVNWGVVDKARWLPGNFYTPSLVFHNVSGDRSQAGILNGATGLVNWGKIGYYHAEAWTYNPVDTLSVDATRPANPAANNAVQQNNSFHVLFDGVGIRTGLRRVFQIPNVLFAQAPIGAAPASVPFSNNQQAANLGSETHMVVGFSFVPANRDTAGGVPVPQDADLRLLNHFRLRVTPSIGDSWSQVPIPLAFYGIHWSVPYRAAFHKPAGGPIYLHAGQSITFDIFNRHATQGTNVQVAVIGRVAPGIGSIA